jgi:hypothetical protein
LGLNQISEPPPDGRLEFVAPLPAEIQADPALALIRHLASSEAAAVTRAKGFEPRSTQSAR